MLILAAFLCFLASTIWAAILRNWPWALLAAGLAFWAATGINIHTS